MAKKIENQAEEQEVKRLSAAEWIEKYSNIIMWVILGILVVVMGILALKRFVIDPKHEQAAAASWTAEEYFEAGDYAKALNGDDADCEGFAAVANEYGNQEGKLAALYAGLCEFELGNQAENAEERQEHFEAAADYIKDFSAEDLNIAPAAEMKLGDVYVEMEEYDKAVKSFLKAAASKNEIIAPVALKKAGIVYIEQGDKAAAKKVFEQIKSDYPMSTEAQDIDKYIAYED